VLEKMIIVLHDLNGHGGDGLSESTDWRQDFRSARAQQLEDSRSDHGRESGGTDTVVMKEAILLSYEGQ
jgi:hypothetical protein